MSTGALVGGDRHGLLLISPELSPRDVGGVGAWADDLGVALQRAGLRPLVAAPSRGGARPPADYATVGMLGHRWSAWGAAWAGLAALRLRGRCDPEAPLLAATWPMAARAAALWPGPLLVACHGSELTALAQAPPALRALDRRAVFLPVSVFLEGELRRLGLGAPAHRLPMALRSAPALADRAGRALVVMARPTANKGLHHAVVLAAGLGRPLWVVGSTAAQLQARCAGTPAALAARAAAPGAPADRLPGEPGAPATGPRIVCFGPLPRPAARALLPRAAAAALLPEADPDGRRAEGLGLALLEAAAAGLPGLALPIGGAAEALGPGRCLPAPSAWTPALFDEINAYIDDPEAGAAAWRWVCGAHSPALAVEALQGAMAEARRRRARG